MSAPVYTERMKENGEEYSFNVYRDAEGSRVVVYDACGEALVCETVTAQNDRELTAKAREFCENYIIAREDRINNRGVAC